MSVISLSPDCLIASAAIGAGGHDFTGIIIELRVPPVSILRPGMMAGGHDVKGITIN